MRLRCANRISIFLRSRRDFSKPSVPTNDRAIVLSHQIEPRGSIIHKCPGCRQGFTCGTVVDVACRIISKGAGSFHLLAQPSWPVPAERSLRHLFETVVERCLHEGLVGGEGFAVDASLAPVNCATASMTCSQQSKTTTSRWLLSATSNAASGFDVFTGIPSEDARALATKRGSFRGLRSIKCTLSNSAAVASTTAAATVVFPIPPGPTIETKRCSSSCEAICRIALSRPTTFGGRNGSERARDGSVFSGPACEELVVVHQRHNSLARRRS
jgi:hypothetical protein